MGYKSYVKKLKKVLEGKTKHQKLRYIFDLGHNTDFIIKEFSDEIKTFEDLNFEPHKNVMTKGAVSSYLEFDNGHFASVVGGAAGLYGDGKETFELGYIDDNDTDSMDVQGWLTPEEVTMVMIQIQTKEPINQNKDE